MAAVIMEATAAVSFLGCFDSLLTASTSQIPFSSRWLRESYTLKRLYRWELTTDNKFVKELRNQREEKGIWLVEAVSSQRYRRFNV